MSSQQSSWRRVPARTTAAPGSEKDLLSLGYVGQSDLAKALARRLRLEFVELSVDDVDPDVAALVDKRSCAGTGCCRFSWRTGGSWSR